MEERNPTIDRLNTTLIEMRKTIPTVWEYQHTHFAHQLNKDLALALEIGHTQFVVADGKFIKIIYHSDVQKTELKISNHILNELGPEVFAHYKELCKKFNDFVVMLHNQTKQR